MRIGTQVAICLLVGALFGLWAVRMEGYKPPSDIPGPPHHSSTTRP